MILAAVFSLSLAIPVALDSRVLPSSGQPEMAPMSLQQKNAALLPWVNSATKCITRKVTADPRLPQLMKIGQIGELIVESVPSCVQPVRAMIDAHDRLFGEGSGKAFFMGPYLDLLPATITKKIGSRAN